MLKNLTWYARRLRAMSPREIGDRIWRTSRHGLDAASFHVAKRAWRARWEPDVPALFSEPALQGPVGFLEPGRAAALVTRFPDDAARLVARADELLEGRYRFFGYPEVTLRGGRGDDVDPFTHRPWPRRHAKRVSFRRGAVGDPKWIWELNRCQDFPMLVAASLVSGDERYAQAASNRMASWIDGHPPGRGIAWSNGFEAALRAISFAVTLDGLRGSDLTPANRVERNLLSLWQHARWIERDPSTGSSANNHRIGELVGLVVVGSLAPELRDAPRWLETGVDGLEKEVRAQIRADGTSVEQAFAYHVFVLDLLLVATAALDRAGHVLPPEIRAALERSADALWAQLGGDDEPEPTYGDSDESHVLRLDGRRVRGARGVAAGIAARLGHARAARVAAGRIDPIAWWLFGEEGAARLAQAEPVSEPGSLTLPDGGLTVLRAGRSRVTLDHGPHGHLGIAAHAHADALRLDVSLGGSELVVDPGVGSYFPRPELREAFRGTGFHATVLVDEVSSSTPGGPFLWTQHADARLLLADMKDRIVLAEHDGYLRLDDPVAHARAAAVLEQGSIVVIDRLEGREAHRYSQRWPLHPTLELERRSEDCFVASGDDRGLVLAFAASAPFELRAVRGEEIPPAGWWSKGLESVVPSWLVSVELIAAGPVRFATLLVPYQGTAAPEAAVRVETGEHPARIVLAHDGSSHVAEFAIDPPALRVACRSR